MMPSVVSAALFKIPKNPPTSYEDIETFVTSALPDRVAKAQCGGFADDTVEGKIADAPGVPGHDTEPLQNILSGMGKRADDFFYPDAETTKGLATACEPGGKDGDQIDVQVWCDNGDGTISRCTKKTPYPYFKDPPCLWRGRDNQVDPPHNAERCQEFCSLLNSSKFQYLDCRTPVAERNPIGLPTGRTLCAQWGLHYTCTQDWIDLPHRALTGQSNPSEAAPDLDPKLQEYCDPTLTDKVPDPVNAKRCIGAECRCPGPGCMQSGPEGGPEQYNSFYRTYDTGYSRRPVITDKATDVTDKTAEVSCIGFYNEFDPKTRKIDMKMDLRCTMDISLTELPETQKIKGKIGENASSDPSGPIVRQDDFDPKNDLWYENMGGATSYLNPAVFEKQYQNDLSTAILTVEGALQISAQQFASDPHRTASSSLIRAFDDTVSNERTDERTVVTWWQTLQTEAHRFFTPPVVRLFVPPAWTFGIDVTDPIFTGGVDMPEPGDARAQFRKDPRVKSIEVQIHAGDDLLGQIATILTRNLLFHVEEEEIPVVVPLISVAELLAIKNAWEAWMDTVPPGTHIPVEVPTIILRLEQYINQVENVRRLRSELPKYIGRMTEAQEKIVEKIAVWLKLNTDLYEQYLKRFEERRKLQKSYTDVAQLFKVFEDDVNMPWCKNDRFTTPIYSFLDPWLKGRPTLSASELIRKCGDAPSDTTLPLFCLKVEEDLVFDFSNFEVSRTETLRIPVLQPTLVKLNIPMPPGEGGSLGDLAKLKLPVFPQIPSIAAEIIKIPPPSVKFVGTLPNITLPSAPNIDAAKKTIADAKVVVEGMSKRYKQFWDAVRRFDQSWKEEEGEMQLPQCVTDDGEQKGEAKSGRDCCGWGQENCALVEMDLMEQLTRIGARPAVLLNEDFQSLGEERIPPICDTEDEVCQALLPERYWQKSGWQILLPERDTSAEDALLKRLRAMTREATIRRTDGNIQSLIPYDVKPHALYPVFHVPASFELLPHFSASSASSSSP